MSILDVQNSHHGFYFCDTIVIDKYFVLNSGKVSKRILMSINFKVGDCSCKIRSCKHLSTVSQILDIHCIIHL